MVKETPFTLPSFWAGKENFAKPLSHKMKYVVFVQRSANSEHILNFLLRSLQSPVEN